MANNALNTDQIKKALNRTSFFVEASKHGITTALGGIATTVAHFGFGLGIVPAALIGVSTKAGSDMAVDLVVKPLYLTGKTADWASKNAAEAK